VATGVISAIFARVNNEKMKRLENELETRKAEEDARRDYEYEAKKRLYQEYEPLMFQLQGLSTIALRRIRNLARDARVGHLGSVDGWLSDMTSYYAINNVYKILTPFCVFRLMQRRLTSFDLRLNPNFNTQYLLLKQLYDIFSKDFDLADIDPKLPYDPHLQGRIDTSLSKLTDEERTIKSRELRTESPEEYRQQGIVWSRFDHLIENLIEYDEHAGTYGIISFGQFEKKLEIEEFSDLFDYIFYIFDNFHPATRPITWRILIVQVIMYKILLETFRYCSESLPPIASLISNSDSQEFREKFDWRNEEEKKSELTKYDYEEPFKVAQIYIQNAVSEMY
jgi:hypothetical protein